MHPHNLMEEDDITVLSLIRSMPGLSGREMIAVLPRSPFLKRRWPLSRLYSALANLERNGLIASRIGSPERSDGLARRHYY